MRNPFTFTFGLLLTLAGSATVVVIEINPGVDPSLTSRLVGGLILTTMTWVIWRFGGHPAVVLAPTHLIIREPFSLHTVPWSSVGTATARDGLRVTVGGRGEVRPWAFSGSLIAALTGEIGASRAATAIANARKDYDHTPGPAKRQLDLGLARLGVAYCWVALLAVVTWLLDPANPSLT